MASNRDIAFNIKINFDDKGATASINRLNAGLRTLDQTLNKIRIGASTATGNLTTTFGAVSQAAKNAANNIQAAMNQATQSISKLNSELKQTYSNLNKTAGRSGGSRGASNRGVIGILGNVLPTGNGAINVGGEGALGGVGSLLGQFTGLASQAFQAVGTGIGAAVGSIIPGVGTIVGGAVGSLLTSAITGLFGTIANETIGIFHSLWQVTKGVLEAGEKQVVGEFLINRFPELAGFTHKAAAFLSTKGAVSSGEAASILAKVQLEAAEQIHKGLTFDGKLLKSKEDVVKAQENAISRVTSRIADVRAINPKLDQDTLARNVIAAETGGERRAFALRTMLGDYFNQALVQEIEEANKKGKLNKLNKISPELRKLYGLDKGVSSLQPESVLDLEFRMLHIPEAAQASRQQPTFFLNSFGAGIESIIADVGQATIGKLAPTLQGKTPQEALQAFSTSDKGKEFIDKLSTGIAKFATDLPDLLPKFEDVILKLPEFFNAGKTFFDIGITVFNGIAKMFGFSADLGSHAPSPGEILGAIVPTYANSQAILDKTQKEKEAANTGIASGEASISKTEVNITIQAAKHLNDPLYIEEVIEQIRRKFNTMNPYVTGP